MMESVASLLAATEQLPAVDLAIDHARGSAEARVGTCTISRIDLEHGHVRVTAPEDTIPTLRRLFPSSRVTPSGIAFDLVDSQGRSEALAAIRRRAHVQRFLWQFRVASP
jgi:hypothetical protein